VKLVTAEEMKYCRDRVQVDCSVKASLRVLRGLSGIPPRMHQVADTGNSVCAAMSVVMDRIPGKPAAYRLGIAILRRPN